MSNRTQSKNTVISRRLRQARQSRDLPQDRLGIMAGLEDSSSSARMSRYESGIHEPTFQFVETIAKVLNISAAFFYCADDQLAEIINIYSDLPETKRKALLKAAVKIRE